MLTRTARLLLPAALALGLLSPAAPTLAQGVKIGTFDPNKILTESKLGQRLQEDINKFRVAKEAELKKKNDEYKRLVDQYKAGVDTMSPERREEIEGDLSGRKRDLEREARDADEDLLRRRQKALRELEEHLTGVIEDYGQKNGYTLILERAYAAYAVPTIDVSSELVRLVDARTPAAPAKPAAKK